MRRRRFELKHKLFTKSPHGETQLPHRRNRAWIYRTERERKEGRGGESEREQRERERQGDGASFNKQECRLQ